MSLELEKEKLERKKQKLLLQERLIKVRERKKQQLRLVQIGKLANRAKIDELDDETILGAFLEIAEKQEQPEMKRNWKQVALDFLRDSEQDEVAALIVSFNSKPDKHVVDLLQGLRFRFNKFRNEYYGHANRKSLEKKLAGSDFSIEVFEE